MPEQFEYEHVLHPTTLEACFQATFIPTCGTGEIRVPTRIESLYVSASMPHGTGSRVCGFSTLFKKGFNSYVGKTVITDTEWTKPVIVLDGVTLTRLQSAEDQSFKDKQPWEIRKIVTNLVWREDVDLLTNANVEKVFGRPGTTFRTPFELRNSYISKWLSLSGRKLPSQHVLHVGGGGGVLALQCLEQLGGDRGETPFFGRYVLAESKSAYLEHAKFLLAPWKGMVDFKTLDIRKDLKPQNFEEAVFDVVVFEKASCCDCRSTLANNVTRTQAPTRFISCLNPSNFLFLVVNSSFPT
jgi:hypothetical protein